MSSRRKSVYVPFGDEEAWQEFKTEARKNGIGTGTFACMCWNMLKELHPEGIVFRPNIFEEFKKIGGRAEDLVKEVLKGK